MSSVTSARLFEVDCEIGGNFDKVWVSAEEGRTSSVDCGTSSWTRRGLSEA